MSREIGHIKNLSALRSKITETPSPRLDFSNAS